ncbi:sel1 repeat family protein [Flavobacteriaceae bacterium LYZ1037]|nr:sel1 repeat family protein [Flavobacteriaceae bacterium LYZ1037]
MVSCKGEASSTAQDTPKQEAVPPQEKATNAAKGIAYFESGLKAAEENNMPLAYNEFLAGAKEGHMFAQYNVGLMYEQGLGISKNAKEAVYWYNQSAKQGNSAAQFNLGVCYENGLGTSVDFEKANLWYRKASVQGDGLAVGNLGMLYIRGQGVKINKVAGIALLLVSATIDTSPENQARNNISTTGGLTAAMVTEAQALSNKMSESNNILVPLDAYLKTSEN